MPVMFVLGLGLAVLVAVLLFVVAWLLLRQMFTPPANPRRERAVIRDIEQQTIHAMLAAELSAQRAAVEARYRRLQP